MKLTAKYFIKGQIKAVTGLHIGGSKTALDIGGIDSNVIKNANGVPYIPGSSLKGKLRTMLAREYGSEKPEMDSDTIKEIFGESPSGDNKEGKITRLIVRDSFLNNATEMLHNEGEFTDLELDYTEGKWENTIDRKKGTAVGAGPRQIERVPAGAIFNFEMVYDVYEDVYKNDNGDNKIGKIEHIKEIIKAMRLLEDDYLGGSGSRGYGKIEYGHLIENKNKDEESNSEKEKMIFESGIVDTIYKEIKDYENGNVGTKGTISLKTTDNDNAEKNEYANESNNS